MKEPKLNWPDLLNLYLWHRYGSDFVQDDTAYVAACRVEEWVMYALVALRDNPPATE